MFAMFVTSCSKDEGEIVQEPTKSSAKQITAFMFKASENDAIAEDITAVINGQSKTISAAVPDGTIITSLKPTLQLSEKAIVDQTGAKDFSSPIDYSVTAEDGTKAGYKTTVFIAPNNAKQLLSFAFKNEDNELYGDETITATIDEVNKTITATVSYSANAALLTPSIEVSPDASVSPDIAQDFSNPVTYTVTAEDGTTVDYQVTLEITFTDRDALIAIYSANPNNTLDWDLQDKDISNWERLLFDSDGNVVELHPNDKNLDILPPEIGSLPNLGVLGLSGNRLITLPLQIGQLKKLQDISIENNQLVSIPTTIGELSSLQFLYLNGNQLTTLPSEIGKLINLQYLEVDRNQLTDIPASIGELSNLEHIELGYNKLTAIPPEIGQLKKLQGIALLNNQLTSLPKEIENLTSLTSLNLSTNEFTSIPPELGSLTSLSSLSFKENKLISVPLEIGNLINLRGLFLNDNQLTSIPKSLYLS